MPDLTTGTNQQVLVKSGEDVALADINDINGYLSTAKLTGAVAIGNGGTNANTVAGARSNLSAAGRWSPVTVNVPLNWSLQSDGTNTWYQQTITVTGAVSTATDLRIYPIDIVNATDREIYNEAYSCLASTFTMNNGSIILYCRDTMPTSAFQIQIIGTQP